MLSDRGGVAIHRPHYFFVVNPTAGGGRCRSRWMRLERHLRSLRERYDVAYTAGPGDASRLAAHAASGGYSAVIAVGGDGTLNGVVNGLLPRQMPVGLLPLGTGNDFARTVGIPREPLAALRTLLQATPRNLDLGVVGEKYFVNIAGTGFDCQVAERINRPGRRLRGLPAYLWASVQTLRRYHNVPLTVRMDGQPPVTRNTFLLAIGNGRYYGGGIPICPQADAADGLLDVCWLEDLSPWEAVRDFPRILTGTHPTLPRVRYARSREVEISGDAPLPVHADGETVGTLSQRFSIRHGGLRFLAPG